jgi:leucyl/phenylalanyl-tRNA--protein transferase
MKIIPPETLLNGYAQGIFPMAESKDSVSIEWYSARKRGIIPLNDFHISKNVARLIRQSKFEIRVDTQFRQVMEHCADRESTWINEIILDSYQNLHNLGYAHSVEVYKNDQLVGGLYGVRLQSAFFGESMFRLEPDMDKIALYYCHQILTHNRFLLWDTQYYTEHLSRFGCIEIDAEEYEYLLSEAMNKECFFLLGS